jgi:hypothetical protein
VLDGAGNIYGTTLEGGTAKSACYGGCGVVYVLDKSKGWADTVLYEFLGGRDGAYPWANLYVDANKNIYGTTTNGGDSKCTEFGSQGCGVVFRITP